MSYRDRKRRTYRAEWALWGDQRSKRIVGSTTIREAQRLVNQYVHGYTVRGNGDGCGGLCYLDERIIVISPCSPRWIVAHEIAHALVEEHRLPEGHHDAFREHYCQTAGDMFGDVWGRRLRDTFLLHGLGVGQDRGSMFESLIRAVEC